MTEGSIRVLVALSPNEPSMTDPSGDDITIIGHVANGHSAVARVLSDDPDVVLLDARLTDVDAPTACRRLNEWSPTTKILTVTALDDERAYETIISGSFGAIPLGADSESVADAIRCLCGGGSVLMSRMAMRLIHDIEEWSHKSADPLYPPPSLTTTEREVLGGLGDGMTPKAIAELFGVTPHLVHVHAGFAISKLHRFALGWGKITQRTDSADQPHLL